MIKSLILGLALFYSSLLFAGALSQTPCWAFADSAETPMEMRLAGKRMTISGKTYFIPGAREMKTPYALETLKAMLEEVWYAVLASDDFEAHKLEYATIISNDLINFAAEMEELSAPSDLLIQPRGSIKVYALPNGISIFISEKTQRFIVDKWAPIFRPPQI